MTSPPSSKPSSRKNPSQTRLLLVRHGQTPWNAAGRWQGHADPGLTEVGRAQAIALAEELASRTLRPWLRLFVSDLSRAKETAEPIATALDVPLLVDPRLRELDVGRWSGLTRAEIVASDRDRLLAFESGDLAVRPGGGESRLELAERARAFAREVASRYPNEAQIVVTHLGIIRALAPGQEPANTQAIEIEAEAAVAPVESSRTGPDSGHPL